MHIRFAHGMQRSKACIRKAIAASQTRLAKGEKNMVRPSPCRQSASIAAVDYISAISKSSGMLSMQKCCLYMNSIALQASCISRAKWIFQSCNCSDLGALSGSCSVLSNSTGITFGRHHQACCACAHVHAAHVMMMHAAVGAWTQMTAAAAGLDDPAWMPVSNRNLMSHRPGMEEEAASISLLHWPHEIWQKLDAP